MKAKLSAKSSKKKFLNKTIEHIDVTKLTGIVPLVDSMQHMAYSARDLARAADIYDRMLKDKECGVILCLAGSLISAGLKKIFVDMIRNNMVDAIVSTGANIVDQDFLHYETDTLEGSSGSPAFSMNCRPGKPVMMVAGT
jgi:deoxyhypusine synthase